MKQSTLKNLLLVIFCSLTLSTITQHSLYADTVDKSKEQVSSLEAKLEGNVADGELKLTTHATHTMSVAEEATSNFHHLNFNIKLNNLLSNKTYRTIIDQASGHGITAALKKLPLS